MLITEGTIVKVHHVRSGKWLAKATKDFDIIEDLDFPLVLAQAEDVVDNEGRIYKEGEDISTTRKLCIITKLKKEIVPKNTQVVRPKGVAIPE